MLTMTTAEIETRIRTLEYCIETYNLITNLMDRRSARAPAWVEHPGNLFECWDVSIVDQHLEPEIEDIRNEIRELDALDHRLAERLSVKLERIVRRKLRRFNDAEPKA